MKTKSIWLVTLFLAIFVLVFYGAILSIYPKKYEDLVLKYAKENNLSPYLVFAVIKTESGFDCDAVSSAGAVGLMQIMPSTAKWLTGNNENLKDPNTNIKIGCLYLSYLQTKFLDLSSILAAYNAGPNKVNIWLEDEKCSNDGITLRKTPYNETNNYIKRVTKAKKAYEILYKF